MTTADLAPSVDVWIFRRADVRADAALEQILASYPNDDGEPPAHHRDRYGRRTIPDRHDLSLSTSSTEGFLAVAVGRRCTVGIDLEVVRQRGIVRLQEHSLTQRERQELSQLDHNLRLRAFLSYWTRKEALLKAAGVGLAVEPNLIELPPPGHGTRVLAVPEELGAAEHWFATEISIDGCVAAAVAGTGSPRLRIRSD